MINKSEIEQFRTIPEFNQWIESKLVLLKKYYKKIRKQELLREGISKQFWEEVYPLYRLLKKQTLLGGNFKVKNIIGSQPYDVEIKYLDCNKHIINKLEFTEAKDGRDSSLRMEKFVETGSVSLTGEIKFSGTKKLGRKIYISDDCADKKDSLDRKLSLIRACISNKKGKKYSSDTALAIVIDDYLPPRYDNNNDLDYVNNFLQNDSIFENTGFAALFFVGLSGGLFFEKHKMTIPSN
ncbi:MAG: hypothetical protein PHX78_04790 [bacterium]|nr:hypothetical protein [bacterium]